MPVCAVVGTGKPVFVVSGELKWDTRFHFLPHFLFALAQLGDFGLGSSKKTKHQAQNHTERQNISTMIQMSDNLDKKTITLKH